LVKVNNHLYHDIQIHSNSEIEKLFSHWCSDVNAEGSAVEAESYPNYFLMVEMMKRREQGHFH